ncbi:phosphate ABC transporter permease subunit PstC [Glycomyces buryatensis]|uniref:Phosphate transport system permease protein n=1 Tax=Glycomyces buryatensis TaxID=2570927 RepID=A0A4S8QCK6_9ACTN|nr:phosphate ABC transporter permease subunit PstC [Glycomyces buryatensis]THV42098.1 phosphate ABC transporter permease subunit PstC [Glycomyces buryatensis]
MTPTATREAPSEVDLGGEARARRADRSFTGLVTAAGLTVLIVLGLILVTTTLNAWPAISLDPVNFLTGRTWDPNADLFGTVPFLYGTVVTSLIGMIIAVPVSIGIALYITEVAHRRFRKFIVTVIDLLATVPSVVFGLVGGLVVIPAITPAYQWFAGLVAPIPGLNAVFSETNTGRNYFTAGLILAVMCIPIITSISREVFSTVPETDKQAAYALGATRWEMIKGAILPHSFGGLVGASMLGLGRAMGETIAVSLVIGGSLGMTPNMFAPGNTMASVIAQQWGESSGLHTDALIGIGVQLFAITVIINFLARAVVRRAEIKMKGAHS